MPVEIANLSILEYPAKVLRTRAKPLREVTDATREVAARMIQLMYEAEGIGLAAPQVGLSWSMFVVHVPENEQRSASLHPQTATSGPIVLINPKITGFEGAPEPSEEGCLSLPEIRGDVLRPPIVTMEAIDQMGKPLLIRAAGLLSRCLQHEFDHLQGVLILDRMTQLSRMKVRSAVRDLERAGEDQKK
jgi:peptide deformylase